MSFKLPTPKAAPSGKEEFKSTTGAPKVLQAPRKARTRLASDRSARVLKLMLFGASGTGKTYGIRELLERGFKIVYITSDIGGDGLLSVEIPLIRTKQAQLLANLAIVEIKGNDEMQSFLKEPAAFFPEIYEFDPDLLFWDGFSGWQQIDLMEAVGDDISATAGTNKVVGDMRSAGNKLEMQDWGTVRQATVKAIDAFCGLHNKKTGKLWHKIVTCLESIKSKPAGNGSTLTETKEPFLSGAGGKFVCAAFDLVLRTVAKTEKDEDDAGVRKYYFVVAASQNSASKIRGFELPPVWEKGLGNLWDELEKQSGIVRGAIDDSAKKEVLLAPAPDAAGGGAAD